jgi:hypothetical protein
MDEAFNAITRLAELNVLHIRTTAARRQRVQAAFARRQHEMATEATQGQARTSLAETYINGLLALAQQEMTHHLRLLARSLAAEHTRIVKILKAELRATTRRPNTRRQRGLTPPPMADRLADLLLGPNPAAAAHREEDVPAGRRRAPQRQRTRPTANEAIYRTRLAREEAIARSIIALQQKALDQILATHAMERQAYEKLVNNAETRTAKIAANAARRAEAKTTTRHRTRPAARRPSTRPCSSGPRNTTPNGAPRPGATRPPPTENPHKNIQQLRRRRSSLGR